MWDVFLKTCENIRNEEYLPLLFCFSEPVNLLEQMSHFIVERENEDRLIGSW